ncbi:adenylyltransferase/cytidyltransferase family protein [Patescibacteria group bacterium]|nr:adenylyltransferase/cytidyltransferase family protein [Patescibacteria group bacterium]
MTKNNNSVTVLVFGTFDGVHSGHIQFLRQARELGDRVVVSLPPAKVVKELKGQKPLNSYRKRKKQLVQTGLADEIIKGDKSIGVFSNVLAYKPSVIALGYDQAKLKQALENWIVKYNINTKIVELKAYKPEVYKSSLFREKSL